MNHFSLILILDGLSMKLAFASLVNEAYDSPFVLPPVWQITRIRESHP
ncbi:hypothetical protein MGWOODY_Tha2661 [hydrothermal vent metagenome]|uniref:Uncharacterized protein n=1 Tax=hydrothermal vent metagenome TaxID=652676 RepID=A0A160TFN7_9ZZZZ